MTEERVLLVDDEQEFVQALSQRLQFRDISVDTAFDGHEALKKANEKKYDLIILDLAMPGLDGIETLKALKADHPDLQVILLTGHGTAQKGVAAMKLGAMDFLEKPVAIHQLIDKIREAKAISSQLNEQKMQGFIDDILRTKGW